MKKTTSLNYLTVPRSRRVRWGIHYRTVEVIQPSRVDNEKEIRLNAEIVVASLRGKIEEEGEAQLVPQNISIWQSSVVLLERCLSHTQDWRKDVNDLLRRNTPKNKIRDAIMHSVEGVPGQTAGVAYKKGEGSLDAILKALDTVHGQSISYIKPNSNLCAIRQYYEEDVVTYYTCMNSIVHLLQEHHNHQFPPGQLENFAKNAFYDGLLEKYQPRISHLRDDPTKDVSDLLASVRKTKEQEERYLSDRRKDSRNGYQKNGSVPTKGYCSYQRDNNNHNNNNNNTNRKDGYGVRVGNSDSEGESEAEETFTEEDRDQVYRDGIYVGISRMADDDDK